jgi:rhomboid protease GluP
MVIVYTVGSIVGFGLSTLSIFVLAVPGLNLLGLVLGGGGGITVGASAGLFGLLGAMVLYGRRVSSAVGRQAWIYVAIFLIFGLLWSGVDNWAHVGGFVGGYLSARVMNPLTAERGDHLIWALVCLAASVAAVGVSVITGWGLLQH